MHIQMKTKKNLFILVVLATSITVNAQKAALHSVSGIKHYEGTNALESAYAESLTGDTIYLSGGGTFEAPDFFSKSLTIYGAGHYPDSTVATGKTFISGAFRLRDNADNFHLEGVHLKLGFQIYENEAVDNVTVKYCNIDGSTDIRGDRTNPSNNITFVNTVFSGVIYVGNAQNLSIRNSIITSQIFDSNGVLYSNNIILANNIYYQFRTSLFRNKSNNNYLENNIIYLTASTYASPNDIVNDGSGNTFRNNVFNSATPNFGNFPTTENNYTAIIAANILVNQSGIQFNYAHDYHLQNPSSYLGTDGTQVGIYGGMFPFKEGAVPSNPYIQEQNIAPTTTGGQLNVQIKATAQDK
jgi:hypothetical protein